MRRREIKKKHRQVAVIGVLLSLNNTKAYTQRASILLSQSYRRPKMPPAFSFPATNLSSPQKFTD
jgi:hypothetical protein